jgi:hypothetical protein
MVIALVAVFLVVLALLFLIAQVLFTMGLFDPPASGVGPRGPGSDGDNIPDISDRSFAGGTTQASTSGFVSLDMDLPIDEISSYVNTDGLAWISFGSLPADARGEILIALNEPENSITLSRGDVVVIGRDDDCIFDLDVTETTVSGHISCTGVEGENTANGSTGPVDIELDFTADS